MNVCEMLETSLQDLVDLNDGYLFDYELETCDYDEYDFEYLMSGYRSGDPEGYAAGKIEVPFTININILFKGDFFAQGKVEFEPDEYDIEYLDAHADEAATNYAEGWIERKLGDDQAPDSVIVAMFCNLLDLPEFYSREYLLSTVPRRLFNASDVFELVV